MSTKIDSNGMTLERIFKDKLYCEYEEKSAAYFHISFSKGDAKSVHVGVESQLNRDVIAALVDPVKVKWMRARRSKVNRQLASNEPARPLEDVYKIKKLKGHTPETSKRKVLRKKVKKIVEPLPDAAKNKPSKKGKKSQKNVKLESKEVKTPKEKLVKLPDNVPKIPKGKDIENNSSKNIKSEVEGTKIILEHSNDTTINLNSFKLNDSKNKNETSESKNTEDKNANTKKNIVKVDIPNKKLGTQNPIVTEEKTTKISNEGVKEALNMKVDRTRNSSRRERGPKEETKNETKAPELRLKLENLKTDKVRPAKPKVTIAEKVIPKPIIPKPKVIEIKPPKIKIADLKPPDPKRKKIIKKESKSKNSDKNKSRVERELRKSGCVLDDKNALPFFARPCAQLKEIKKLAKRGERPQYHGIHMHTKCFKPRGYPGENCGKTAVFERYLKDVERLNGGPLEAHVYRRGRLYDGMCQELVSLEKLQEKRPREFVPRATQCGECRRHENEAETLFLYKSSHQDEERNVVRQAGYPII